MDPEYEFQAPQYRDFDTRSNEEEVDEWFDVRDSLGEDQDVPMQENRDSTNSSGKKRPAEQGSDYEEAYLIPLSKKSRRVPEKILVPKLTEPKTPNFNYHTKQRQVLSSESQELQRIRDAVRAKKKAREERERSMQKALSSRPQSVHSTRALTEPVEFNFSTRRRAPQIHEEEQLSKVKKNTKRTGELTEPQEFHFNTEARIQAREAANAKEQTEADEYVERERLVRDFLHKTPKRFRSKISPVKLVEAPKGPTQPIEFSFHETRRKGTDYKGREAIEEEELESMPRFKALPLRQEILESVGDLGVPRVKKVAPTQAKTPYLETKKRSSRIREREMQDFPQEDEFVFKAKPVYQPVQHNRIEEIKKSVRQLTVPQSPQLATKARFQHRKAPEQEEEVVKFQAKPIPISVPFIPHREAHYTESEPFKFEGEQQSLAYMEKLRQRREAEEEEEHQKTRFRALPVPPPSPEELPEREPLPLTEPEPFHLESDIRHKEYMNHLREEIASREAELERMAAFKATPVPPTINCPDYIPQPSSKPLTEVEEFDLNTARRMGERKKYDERVKEKIAAAEQAELERKMEELNEMEKEMKEYRKSLRFQAQPIRNYKISTNRDTAPAPLTVPQSPKFSYKNIRA